MAKKLMPMHKHPALKWREGLVVVGYFMEAGAVPKADSRLVLFDLDGKANDIFGVWESRSLAYYVALMKPGTFYSITCTGKVQYKGGKGFAFDVFEHTNDEIQKLADAHSATVRELIKEAKKELEQ